MKTKITSLTTILGILVLLLVGCQEKPMDPPKEASAKTSYSFNRGGAPITVNIHLSKAEPEITDFLTVTVETLFDEGVLPTPPVLGETVYSPLMLIDSPKEETYWSEDEQMMINRWSFKFEPLSSGEFSLKPFTIHFRLSKEKSEDPTKWPVYQIHTEEIPYRVKGIDGNNLGDLRAIKGMILPGYNFIPLITILGFVLVTVGGYLVIRYLLNQRKDPIDLQAAKVDFYQRTLTRIERLEKQDLINKAQFNAFHTELADILREYVENVFGIRAKEQTTEEFISTVSKASRFNRDQNQMLNRFLKLADLVKFATFDPGSEISKEALINVRDFVQSTGKPNEI